MSFADTGQRIYSAVTTCSGRDASAANAGGEIAFLLASVNAVRDAIAGLWATNVTQTDEEREARAGWLLEALYADHLCVRAVAQLPPGDIKDHELVGVSVGSLIAAGLEMRLEGRCTSQALRDYLYWLYHRILHYAFERDDRVLQSAGAFIRTTLRTLLAGGAGGAEGSSWEIDRVPLGIVAR